MANHSARSGGPLDRFVTLAKRIISFRRLGPYATLVEIACLALLMFFLLRVVLVICFTRDSAVPWAERCWLFVVGLRFDLLVAAGLVLPQSLHLTLLPSRIAATSWNRWVLEFEWLLSLLFLPWICITEYYFFEEFQSRLNYIAFE